MGFGWFEFLICLSHNRNVCSLNWKLDENCPPARTAFFLINANQHSCWWLGALVLHFLSFFFRCFSFLFFLIYWMLHLKSWRFNLRNYDIHFVFFSLFVYISTINFGGGFLMKPGSFGGSNWDVSRRCLGPPTKYRTNFFPNKKRMREREREWKRAVRCKGGRIWPGTFYHHRQNVCCEWCFVCVSWCR